MSDRDHQTSEAEAWDAFVKAAKVWSQFLNQWDRIKFPTKDGMIYVSIACEDPFPEIFHEV